MRFLVIFLAVGAAFGALASAIRADQPAIAIEVPSTAEATDASGADVSYHVKSRLNLVVTCTPAGSGTDFTATSHFPIGTSSITCSDTNGNTKSENVKVQDTTPPTVNVPSGASGTTTSAAGTATVTWPDVGATDAVDVIVAATCTPASGSSFPVGNTTVKCTAKDSHGNEGTGTFVVTVTFTDVTPPTLTVPGNLTAEATSGAGAVVTYTASASDDSGRASVTCNRPSGSTFPLGPTTVTCTASDAAGNSSPPGSFTVTVVDRVAPSLKLPGNITVEADSPAGKAVTYAASATDSVSGSLTANCSPASGTLFSIGTTAVNCSATDAASNTANGSFSVTVRDSAGPTFTGVPGNIQVEANGPAGSVVNYTPPSASDTIDGPQVVGCNPKSGSTFAVGATTVTCGASDAHGNSSTTSFQIVVVDTVAPSLVVPSARSVYATTPDGIPDSEPAINDFIRAASAADLVDPNPSVTNDIRSFVPVGVHTVTFIARDASGNAVARQVQLTVLPMPPPGTPPLPIPPAAGPPQNVRNLKAEAGDARVRLTWQLAANTDHVVVSRSLTAGGDVRDVYTGRAESFLDRTVVNGLEYRYLVVSVDAAGNTSPGVAAVALPKAALLKSPKDGARLRKPPKLVWLRNGEAAYYNVQLFRGETKILSVWPNRAALALTKTWRFQGRSYALTPGTYRWYVWPGFGARANVDYGELLGFRTFEIVR